MLSRYVEASGDRSILTRALPLAEVKRFLIHFTTQLTYSFFRKSYRGGVIIDLFR